MVEVIGYVRLGLWRVMVNNQVEEEGWTAVQKKKKKKKKKKKDVLGGEKCSQGVKPYIDGEKGVTISFIEEIKEMGAAGVEKVMHSGPGPSVERPSVGDGDGNTKAAGGVVVPITSSGDELEYEAISPITPSLVDKDAEAFMEMEAMLNEDDLLGDDLEAFQQEKIYG